MKSKVTFNACNRPILLIIILILTLVILLCACDKTPDDPIESDSISESENGSPVGKLELIKDGKVNCQVIYGSSYGGDAGLSFALLQGAALGVEIPFERDFIDEDSTDIEILFGETDRAESALFGEVIRASGDWVVKVVNNKLVVVGGSASAYSAAVEYIKANYMDTSTKTLEVPMNLNESRLLADNENLSKLTSSVIVYSSDATDRVKNAVKSFISSFKSISGVDLTVAKDSVEKAEYEIVVGNTNRHQSNTMFLYDYSIEFEGNNVYIDGGCSLAIETAINKFFELIDNNTFESYEYKFDTSLFNPLAFDQSTFVPVWKDRVTVPEWMTDFNEKLYALTNPSGHPMSVSHRSDRVNYPENSVEGCLSAALLGADVIEMDLYLTKDNVLVLCHNSTLDATTNVKEMMGKNGLPKSNKVCDWTYAQLQQLNLLTVQDKTVTEYKMPSFYEILCLLRDRCFIMIDRKADIFGQDDVMEHLVAADNLQSAFYSMFVSAKTGPGPSNSHTVISQYSKAHPENTKLADYCQKFTSYMAMPGHSKRSRGWLNGTASTNPDAENLALYKKAFDGGLRLIYTNNIELLSTFVAQYEPDLK